MPTLFLALNYWLHLLATIVWIGGLASLTIVVWPGIAASALKVQEGQPAAMTSILDAIEKRFRPLANLSLVVLLTTGLIQMGDDPHYTGFLKIDSLWAVGLLSKHIIIGVMIILMLAIQFSIQPALARAVLIARKGAPAAQAEEDRLRRRLKTLAVVNLALGILVLMLTAIITAIP
jgi:uncharacterized membrane protein